MSSRKNLSEDIQLPAPTMKVYDLISRLTKDELRVIIHEICGSSALPIAEIREIVNDSGYND